MSIDSLIAAMLIRFPAPYIYIYKVYIPVMLSMCKETQKLALWFDIFLKKACVVFKKALPLHPLSGTKFSVSN